MPLIRLAGYTLLVLSLFDYISIFIPFSFNDINQEFRLIAELIERNPVPLIGLTLVLIGEEKLRKSWEIPLVKTLSWLSLIVGLLFILLIPIIFTAGWLINHRNALQAKDQVMNTKLKFQQINKQVNQAKNTEEFNRILYQFNYQGSFPDINNSQALEQTKIKLTEELSQADEQTKKQIEVKLRNSRLTIFKNVIKYFLATVVSGMFFIYCFLQASWVRRMTEKF